MEILLVLFKSGLAEEEVVKKFNERAYKYRQVKGLEQKYYVHDESSGEFGGVYIFDSKENLEAFRNSDLAKSIGDAYKYLEPPTGKVLNVNLVLYEDKKQRALMG
jgi:heme-degrading monooxygenase HmoA